MDLLKLIQEGITYDLIKALFMALIGAASATFIAGKVLKILESKKDVFYFAGTIFSLVLIALILFGPQTNAPKLAGGIQNVSTGGINQDKDTIAAVTVTVMNIGSMQSIVKGWDIRAKINGNSYRGGFVSPPPSKFTFNSLNAEPGTPSAVVYKGEDSLLEKTMVPIQPGGLVTGIFFVLFPKLSPDIFRSGVEFSLDYQDVMSRPYIMQITTSAQIASLTSAPGLHSDLVCPLPSKPLSLPPNHNKEDLPILK